MKIIDNIKGRVFYFLARLVELLLGFLLDLTDFIIKIMKAIGVGVVSLLGVGIIFFIMLLLSPLGMILMAPILLGVIVFILLGVLASKLREVILHLRYTLSEYLYDRAYFHLEDKKPKFSRLSDYFREYIRLKEEEIRREERRQAEERRRREEYRRRSNRDAWEDVFNRAGAEWYYYDGKDFKRAAGSGSSSGNFSPFSSSFREDYERACDALGVPYSADKNMIRKAYRQKAKEYHPDLNKSEGATEKFQEINEANEFLNEENMKRYNQMK